jgi:glycosyltransferase involved in cell wall biosynthesis
VTQRRIKVMFAIPALDHAGPDRVLYELLCAIDRTRFEPVLLVTSGEGYFLARLPADVRVCVLGFTGNRLRDRYPVGRALRTIWREKPDVVLATLNMIVTLGVGSAMFPRRTRLIVRPANDFTADFARLVDQSPVKHRVTRQLTMSSLRSADAIVCQSEAMRSDLGSVIRRDAGLHVIGNPVDVDKVSRAASDTVTLPGRPSLISVGRLAPQKGFDLLLPAIAEVRKRFTGLHLTILGDGPDRSALEEQARALGLEDVVTFAGFSAEPLPLVHAADLFVLSSRYEGFPNAALEALACGTPVVLTNCPGANSEIVLAGRNGRLVPAIEPTAITSTLTAALEELATYDRGWIQDDTRRRYGAQRIVGAYEHLIMEVAA